MTIINLFIVYMENKRLSIYLSQFDTNLNSNFPHIMLQENKNNHYYSIFNFQLSSPESLQPKYSI